MRYELVIDGGKPSSEEYDTLEAIRQRIMEIEQYYIDTDCDDPVYFYVYEGETELNIEDIIPDICIFLCDDYHYLDTCGKYPEDKKKPKKLLKEIKERE